MEKDVSFLILYFLNSLIVIAAMLAFLYCLRNGKTIKDKLYSLVK